MRVVADITKEDYWKFNRYAIRNVPNVRTIFIISALILPAGVLAYELIRSVSPSIMLISIPISIIAGFLLMLFITKRQSMSLVKKRKGLVGEYIFEIGKSGFKETTPVSKGSVPWKGVKSIKENDEYIYIFKEKMMGHIIPKRAFSSPEEAKEFYDRAISFWSTKKDD